VSCSCPLPHPFPQQTSILPLFFSAIYSQFQHFFFGAITLCLSFFFFLALPGPPRSPLSSTDFFRDSTILEPRPFCFCHFHVFPHVSFAPQIHPPRRFFFFHHFQLFDCYGLLYVEINALSHFPPPILLSNPPTFPARYDFFPEIFSCFANFLPFFLARVGPCR